MFERFTDEARQAVVLAQQEARDLAHNYIGTEHLLLGLLRQEGAAGAVIESLGLTLDAAREHVLRIVGPGDVVTTGQIPFTPRAKKVLELSLREALGLGHNDIGTEHVLLGLVRDHEGVAARILLDAGAPADAVREAVLAELPPPTGARPGGHVSVVRHVARRWEYHLDDELTTERLNALGADGWELAAAVARGDATQLVFKRPARTAAAEPAREGAAGPPPDQERETPRERRRGRRRRT